MLQIAFPHRNADLDAFTAFRERVRSFLESDPADVLTGWGIDAARAEALKTAGLLA